MGWFMVKSGLTENPDVSHFRLSAHLLIAFIIYSMLLFYLWVKIILLKKNIDHTYRKPERFTNLPIFVCIILVLFTIVTGAFVAGTKAGWGVQQFSFNGERVFYLQYC
jgi:cytochrome c oxidase assembly protein subunit 15